MNEKWLHLHSLLIALEETFIMDIKEQYRRFRHWQVTPMEYKVKSQAPCRCANCGHDVTTMYCPVCGQKSDVGRITWQTARQGVMLLWGMDNRSLPYTLWQLLWRPGYLIRDYLKGRRKVSFPPVKMLFILVVFSLLIDHLVGVSTPEVPTAATAPTSSISDFIEHFFDNNLGWALLGITSMIILPTWALFRHSPLYNRHTIPEGFFIQVFMSTLILILSIISTIIHIFSETIGEWMALFVIVYYFATYYQLFGYGWWGTTWRFIICIFATSLFFAIIILTWKGLFASDASITIEKHKVTLFLVSIGLMLVIYTAVLGVGYMIDKWTSRRKKKRIANGENG